MPPALTLQPRRGPQIIQSVGWFHDQPGGVAKPRAHKAWCRRAQGQVRAAPGEGWACPAGGQSLCTPCPALPVPQCPLLPKMLLDFSRSPSFQGPSIQVLLPEVPAWISPGERTGWRCGRPCPTMPFSFVGESVISAALEEESSPHSHPFPVLPEDCPHPAAVEEGWLDMGYGGYRGIWMRSGCVVSAHFS